MKYITTDLHPELKPGIVLNELTIEHAYYFECGELRFEVHRDKIYFWAEKGYIKEIQEPEYTDDDLKDFIFFCDISDDLDLDTLIKKWKESKKNKNL